MFKPQSLQSLAVQYLSRREYSRSELARKLAQPSAAAIKQSRLAPDLAQPKSPSVDEINAVLDELEKQDYLNDARFALSLVHRKAGKLGASRLMQELSQHKLDSTVASELSNQLKSSEQLRCFEAWSQRFSHKDLSNLDPLSAHAAKDKQMRFLIARGFASDAVRKVLRGWKPEDEE